MLPCVPKIHDVTERCTASDMKEMTWDSNLASVAQKYAAKCVWEHNPNRNEEAGKPVGENLYSTTKSIPSPISLLAGLEAWYSEVIAYNWTDGSCDLQKSPDGCGHYTQMVWGSTHSEISVVRKWLFRMHAPPARANTVLACTHMSRGWVRRRHVPRHRRSSVQ